MNVKFYVFIQFAYIVQRIFLLTLEQIITGTRSYFHSNPKILKISLKTHKCDYVEGFAFQTPSKSQNLSRLFRFGKQTFLFSL